MFKSTLIILVILILMEDGSSMRKTEEERKEDEEIAAAVNRTLAVEEKKKKEEEDEKKKKEAVKKGSQGRKEDVESQDEACPPVNVSCPIVEPCPPCPEVKECETCKPSKDCPPVKKCGLCEICKECEPCKICKECGQCPTVKPCFCPEDNRTGLAVPDGCPEPVSAMTIPVAMAVGAGAALLVTGVATVVGLVIRYVPPTVSGFLFMAIIIFVWYLSSQYPETARELGGRAWTALQEATVALGNRVVEAIQRHQDQVGLLTNPNLFFRLSSMFQRVCTKIFYVKKINF
jgi:hypothetical protein